MTYVCNMYVRMGICIYIYIYVSIYVCMCVRTNVYTVPPFTLSHMMINERGTDEFKRVSTGFLFVTFTQSRITCFHYKFFDV